MRESFNVGMLATANVAGGAVQQFFANLEPVMHVLVTLGQLGVAVVTIIYIVKKIKSAKKSE